MEEIGTEELNYDVLEKICEENDPQYNEDKLLEEILELAEILIKRRNKAGTEKFPSKEHLIEELGDVSLRGAMLTRAMGIDNEVNNRFDYKANKYISYYNKGEYKGRI